jgi:hypothetical protein
MMPADRPNTVASVPTGRDAAMSTNDRASIAEDADALVRLLADATIAAQVHVDEDGLCQGCLAVWSRLAPWPCTQAQWARAVLDEYDRRWE